MSWKQNYSKARNASWIWYLLALFCFVQAVTSYHDNGGQVAFSSFVWVGACIGLVFSARKKRKATA